GIRDGHVTGVQTCALPIFEDGDHPLFDTWVPDSVGGTGRVWAWPQAREVVRKYPVVVSGGLTPGNVDGAVRELHPWAVDVCSGRSEERRVGKVCRCEWRVV